MENKNKTAIIIGAGPAGLTAAYELLDRSDIKPIVLEADTCVGGISRTVNYKGNRIDIGGHRFFSKSDWVMEWWLKMIPIEGQNDGSSTDDSIEISYQNKKKTLNLSELKLSDDEASEKEDHIMLVRNRISRIFYLKKFFDYPLKINMNTVQKMGFFRIFKIMLSYLKARLFPVKPESNLEDFFINRFGRRLYKTFFKDYTEKVWGVGCRDIPADWGRQRIKGISISKTIKHALKGTSKKSSDISQKETETSLIEKFLYPKFGPGQLWESVADKVSKMGGEVHMQRKVVRIDRNENTIRTVTTVDENGKEETWEGDYFFSTMPVKDLIASMKQEVPQDVNQVANDLSYRDFITVGVLLNKMNDPDGSSNRIVKDNWIYIQESDVKVGRLQIFNNWSPYMVEKESEHIWIGLEYFVQEGDDFWNLEDDKLKEFAISELVKIKLVEPEDVLDSVVIRVPKTYPSYFGAYKDFNVVQEFTDTIDNLFLVGRNGMHKYNNQDHSMLSAKTAVDNILSGNKDKSNIWQVNTEQEYHEEKSSA